MVMTEESTTGLSGMKEICSHMNRSEATVLKMIRESDFPAIKIGGVWESDKALVEKWRKEQIVAANGKKDN